MPGPKMGPRPADFDEEVIRQSPTFLKWASLETGEKMRYACREFIKGHGDDEERLMRRIMIARRNNIRDHEVLKKARKTTRKPEESHRRRRPASTFSDQQVENEMDFAAVEATRSYRAWAELPDGAEFVYNQKYVKGKGGHDWLLRKNIWRRMRYRRENKKMVQKLQDDGDLLPHKPALRQRRRAASPEHSLPSEIGGDGHENVDMDALSDSAPDVDAPMLQVVKSDHRDEDGQVQSGDDAADPSEVAAAAAAAVDAHSLTDQAAVDAAVAAAESFGKTVLDMTVVDDPLDSAALDAAAKLAAATAGEGLDDDNVAAAAAAANSAARDFDVEQECIV